MDHLWQMCVFLMQEPPGGDGDLLATTHQREQVDRLVVHRQWWAWAYSHPLHLHSSNFSHLGPFLDDKSPPGQHGCRPIDLDAWSTKTSNPPWDYHVALHRPWHCPTFHSSLHMMCRLIAVILLTPCPLLTWLKWRRLLCSITIKSQASLLNDIPSVPQDNGQSDKARTITSSIAQQEMEFQKAVELCVESPPSPNWWLWCCCADVDTCIWCKGYWQIILWSPWRHQFA